MIYWSHLSQVILLNGVTPEPYSHFHTQYNSIVLNVWIVCTHFIRQNIQDNFGKESSLPDDASAVWVVRVTPGRQRGVPIGVAGVAIAVRGVARMAGGEMSICDWTLTPGSLAAVVSLPLGPEIYQFIIFHSAFPTSWM